METIDIDGVSYRYCVMGRKMGFDEDETCEFKGHLNFTKEQIPPHAHDPVYDRPSRQPISKTINAMLNTTSGGTIYLSISDDTKVHGMILNMYKIDHIEQNLQDVLNLYTPHVPRHRYTVNFVPVININDANYATRKAVLFDPRSDEVSDVPRDKAHQKCWCDRLLGVQYASGLLNLQYVIEIVIHAWDPSDPRNDGLTVGKMRAHPIHMNEHDRAYCRCSASVREFTEMELIALATKPAVDDYDPIQQRKETHFYHQL